MSKHIVVAITGASGAAYAMRLIDVLLEDEHRVDLLVSDAARVVIDQELDLYLPEDPQECIEALRDYLENDDGLLKVYDGKDWFAPAASGSASIDAMVICPASGGVVSSIAHGASNNLIERAADVAIKEQRKLIVIPRETPVSAIHLRNQLTLAELGVCVLPASPGFYQNPETIGDLVDFIVARILQHLDISHDLFPTWGE